MSAGPNDGLPKAAALDRATPRHTWEGFLAATHAGDYLRAAQFLDLRGVLRAKQANEGPVLAQRLSYVVDRKLPIDLASIPDTPEATGPLVTIGTIFVDDEPIPISLARVRFDDGVQRWLVARATVAVVPELYKEFGPHGWEDRLPRVLVQTRYFGIEAWQWLALLAAITISWLSGWILGSLFIGIARRIARRTTTGWDDELVVAARGPVRLVLAVAFIWFLDEPLHFTPPVEKLAHKIAFPVLVVGVAWMIVGAVGVAASWILSRIPEDPGAEMRTRGLRTQLSVMQRVTSIVVSICAAAVILMQFEFVRSVGLSLLASAGLVGVVLGLAAQRSLAGIIAGIQLSITQPIRIGDSVMMEGEFGTIEEINLTYVVVKVWDERRLMVPIAKFLETTFQNWTKFSPELLGTVMIPADFAVPVAVVRAELERIVKADDRWDGRLCSLKVTELTDKVAMLRVLVSAADADRLFDLRCRVREDLMRFITELEAGKYMAQVRSRTI
ncbi:MAG: mechanosensitive ion channel family protein [Polyangiales bacterium]